MIELAELGAKVDGSPKEVADRASEILATARASNDVRTAALAATFLARARRNLGEHELAERAVEDAIRLASAVGGDVLADAHLAAASIASFRQSASSAAMHLAEAERHGSAQLRAEVRLDRAVIAKREGRLDEALAAYQSALPDLRAMDDPLATAKVLSNMGTLDVVRGNPTRALQEFAEARQLFADAHHEFAVALVVENMAEATAALGDIPAALALLDEADALSARHEHHLQHNVVFRAETLMAAGLFGDAVAALEPAIRASAAEGDRAGMAEALLLQAEATRLAGRDASGAAERARSVFAELGAVGWEHQARLELLRATIAADRVDERLLESAEQLALALAGSGQARTEVEAWELTTRIALRLGSRDRAERAATRCKERAAAIPFVEHRLAAAHASASVLAATGETDRALSVVTDILAEFDRYRRAIGSPDARSASGLHAGDLLALGADLSIRTGNAASVLAWSEQRRHAVAAWTTTTAANDAESAGAEHREAPDRDAAAEHRAVVSELREAESAGATTGRDITFLHQRRAELEHELRDALLRGGSSEHDRSDPDRFDAPIDPADLGAHIGVSLDVHGDRLHAVVVEGGELRGVDLGSYRSALSIVTATSRLLTMAARSQAAGAMPPSIGRQLATSIERLGGALVDPLGLAPGPLVLAMPPDLHAAPWSATEAMRGRAVSNVPSLHWWIAAGAPRGGPLRRVAAIAGPRLAMASTEAAVVAARHDGASIMIGDDARREDVLRALSAADLVHLAAHTHLRRDNPMWSTIELSDGPLLLHEIARTRLVADVIVLSTCESAIAGGTPGAMLPGLAAALLAFGATCVIATISLLPDDPTTVASMANLHELLANGVAPSDALATIRTQHTDALASISLAAWGRGDGGSRTDRHIDARISDDESGSENGIAS